jgi:hypothetical protein
VKTKSLSLTNPNFCSRFISCESGVKLLIYKAFQIPSFPRVPERTPLQPQDCGYENRRVLITFSHKNTKKHANPINFSESVATKD